MRPAGGCPDLAAAQLRMRREPRDIVEPAVGNIGSLQARDGPGLVDVAADPTGYGDQLAALRG